MLHLAVTAVPNTPASHASLVILALFIIAMTAVVSYAIRHPYS